MIVSVGFLSAFDANGEPSVRNRFFTSHVWFHLLVTLFFGSSPMIAPPTSWMILPGFSKLWPGLAFLGARTVPPIASIKSAKVFSACLAWLISWLLHFQWNRSAGMPN